MYYNVKKKWYSTTVFAFLIVSPTTFAQTETRLPDDDVVAVNGIRDYDHAIEGSKEDYNEIMANKEEYIY